MPTGSKVLDQWILDEAASTAVTTTVDTYFATGNAVCSLLMAYVSEVFDHLVPFQSGEVTDHGEHLVGGGCHLFFYDYAHYRGLHIGLTGNTPAPAGVAEPQNFSGRNTLTSSR